MRAIEFSLVVVSTLAGFASLDYNMGSTEPVKYESMIPEVVNPLAIVYISADGAASDIQREEYENLNVKWVVDNHPDWVKDLPTTHFQKDGRWWAVTGVMLKSRFDIVVLGKDPPKPKVQRVVGYQIRFDNRQWTFPGDIRSHLLGGMHGFTAEELRGYSTSQLIQIHNYEHENGRPRLNYRQTSRIRFRSDTYCPT